MSLLLLFGQPAAVTYNKTGTTAAGTELAGQDVFEATETGTAAAGARAQGADVHEAAKTGVVAASTRLAGSAQAGFTSKLGTAAAGAAVTGADVFTASRTGTAAAATWASGSDASTATRSGAVKATARFSGFTRGQPAPAGKFVLTNAKVVIGGVNVSQACKAVSVQLDTEEIDITPLGSPYRDHMQGMTTGQFKIDLFADPASVTPAFWSMLDSPTTIQVTPRDLPTSDTNPTWTGDAIAVHKTELTGHAGEAATATVELHSTGPVVQLES